MVRILCALALLAAAAAPPARADAPCADLALVLAIDSSSSIDDAEFALQMQGYAAAFADPAVLRALAATGRVDVAVLLWSGPAARRQMRAWQRIEAAADAAPLRDWFRTTPRRVSGETDLAAALATALDLIEAQGCGLRRIVNISGDGRASTWSAQRAGAPTLSQSRARADRLGVTVNALAVANVEPALADYYRQALITGPGCFVMETRDFAGFSRAILQKLEREIAPQLTAALAPAR